ncbi:MAG: hypothetical protein RL721_1080 [Candidatus Eisenbacteria bacterium]
MRLRVPPLDWPLAFGTLGLVAIGLLTVYSATSVPGAHEGLWIKQFLWFGAALVAAWIVASIHYRVYDSFSWPMYIVSLVLLVLVFLIGVERLGAKRWIAIGGFQFQPSEIAKVATAFVLARYFDNPRLDLSRIRWWLPPILIAIVPFVLVAKEPDLGTASSFPAMLIAMFFWAGLRLSSLLVGLSPIVAVAAFVLAQVDARHAAQIATIVTFIYFAIVVFTTRPKLPFVVIMLVLNLGLIAFLMPKVYDNMHDYQKKRVETFLNPEADKSGSGYQVFQSKIAIGSGGLVGKGYLQGSQKALSFLPMRHTDFIYSVVGEEFGLLGALTVILLYGIVILRGYRLAVIARDGFAGLMAVGITTALFFHIMVNMLMTVGWAPVTGVPLPFLSYGGTALIVNCVQIGLLQNVALRRREY